MIKNDNDPHANHPFSINAHQSDADANAIASELIGRRNIEKLIETFSEQLEDMIRESIDPKHFCDDGEGECHSCCDMDYEFISMIMERIMGEQFIPNYTMPAPLPENTVRLSDIISQVNKDFTQG